MVWCYHSSENSSAVLSHGTNFIQCVVLTFESVDNLQIKLLKQY